MLAVPHTTNAPTANTLALIQWEYVSGSPAVTSAGRATARIAPSSITTALSARMSVLQFLERPLEFQRNKPGCHGILRQCGNESLNQRADDFHAPHVRP